MVDLDFAWHSEWCDYTKSYYTSSCEYRGMINGKPKYKTHKLHSFIMNSNKKIDHINHNTLDNRKENLRFISNEDNSKNRKSRNKNNTSGYRNVSWIDSYNKWCVQLQIDGKNTLLGKFDNVEEAGIFAEQMRKKHYNNFAGNN